MTQFLSTFIIAFIIIALALALMAIGWLITGKSRIKAGSCGRLPTNKKDEECGNARSCGLCEKDPKEKDSNK